MAHKNVFLRNYKGLDKYIANDFKHMGLHPSVTADYISWLDSHITQRPLFYITKVLVNVLNNKLYPFNLKIVFEKNELQIKQCSPEKETNRDS